MIGIGTGQMDRQTDKWESFRNVASEKEGRIIIIIIIIILMA